MWSKRQGWITVVSLVAVFCGLAAAGPVRFEREAITVWVTPDAIRVEGAYTFVNTLPVSFSQGLFYPFPIDSLHPDVNNVSVHMGGSALEFKRMSKGVGFTIMLPASGSGTAIVSYEQSALDSSGCYILTSTSAWDAPLEEARFKVHIPDTLELIDSSYEFDRVTAQDGERIYRFVRTDFLPETDLCLRWRRR
ncbi:MAG: hypothetical protein P8181_09165 [bacterium]